MPPAEDDRHPPLRPAPLHPDRPLVFMHVPKTAGTTLTNALDRALGTESLQGFDLSLFGAFRDFDSFSDAERARVHLRSEELAADARLVLGHFARSTLVTAYPGARMVTVLREPTTRLLSLWMFWRAAPDEALGGLGGWADRVRLARLPLARSLADPAIACQTDNQAVRMLLWPHPLIPDDDFIAPAHDEILLDEARRRLGDFDFVGLVEDPALAERLGQFLGREVRLERLNETAEIPAAQRSPLARELDAEAHARMRACTRLDDRLWADQVARLLPQEDPAALRERTLLAAVARYATLMTG